MILKLGEPEAYTNRFDCAQIFALSKRESYLQIRELALISIFVR